MAHRGDIRIGVSGWTYRPWRGTFYPNGLPQKDELRHAASAFNSIEINGSFYGLQRPASFAAWDAATPEDFVFAIKGSRYLTHMLKLRNAEVPLANFLASGPLRLGDKLGPILWQFPERFRFDPDRLEAFFELLPRTGREAAALADRHDSRMKYGVFAEANGVRTSATPSRSVTKASVTRRSSGCSRNTGLRSSAPTPSTGRCSWT
jgi:uncharacterized protein YecE (DUF72 family)